MKLKSILQSSLIILLLTGSTLISQPVNNQDTCLHLTHDQKATLAQSLNELDYRREQVDSLNAIIAAQDTLLENKDVQISLQDEMIRVKNAIILKMETTPIPQQIIEVGWKWYEITGAILVSLVTGYSVGKWIAK